MVRKVTKKKKIKFTFESLPEKAKLHIFGCLGIVDLIKCEFVCKSWRELSQKQENQVAGLVITFLDNGPDLCPIKCCGCSYSWNQSPSNISELPGLHVCFGSLKKNTIPTKVRQVRISQNHLPNPQANSDFLLLKILRKFCLIRSLSLFLSDIGTSGLAKRISEVFRNPESRLEHLELCCRTFSPFADQLLSELKVKGLTVHLLQEVNYGEEDGTFLENGTEVVELKYSCFSRQVKPVLKLQSLSCLNLTVHQSNFSLRNYASVECKIKSLKHFAYSGNDMQFVQIILKNNPDLKILDLSNFYFSGSLLTGRFDIADVIYTCNDIQQFKIPCVPQFVPINKVREVQIDEAVYRFHNYDIVYKELWDYGFLHDRLNRSMCEKKIINSLGLFMVDRERAFSSDQIPCVHGVSKLLEKYTTVTGTLFQETVLFIDFKCFEELVINIPQISIMKRLMVFICFSKDVNKAITEHKRVIKRAKMWAQRNPDVIFNIILGHYRPNKSLLLRKLCGCELYSIGLNMDYCTDFKTFK